MAVRTRKFNTTTVDANGNLHANGVGTTGPGRTADQVRQDYNNNIVTSAATPAAGMAASKSNVMGSPDIYPGSLHGQSANNPTTVTTYSNGATPGGRNSTSYKSLLESWENTGKPSYDPSDRVNDYADRLSDWEDAEKPTWQSKYEPTIQGILDNILNRKAFNINDDANYKQLYDQYAQNYMLQGNRAMRDQLGASAGLTGGYGSTAAQAAASQAYDNYMEQLNDRNLQLMNLAYGMYQDETADRYNQLGAVTNLDNIDYGRYRDDVSDFFNERDYWANRYQQEYANDYGQYRDDVSDYYNDLNYYNNRYMQEYGNETEADNTAYARFQDAANMAMQYAQKGLPIPSYIAKQITDYTGAADIADVIAAMPVATGGSGGGGGGRRGRSGGGSSKKEKEISYPTYANNGYNAQMKNGAVENVTNRNTEDWVYIEGIGRITWTELYNQLNSDTPAIIKRTNKGKITYEKAPNYSGLNRTGTWSASK